MAGKSGKPHKAKPSSGGTRKYYRNLVGKKAGNISTYRARKQRGK